MHIQPHVVRVRVNTEPLIYIVTEWSYLVDVYKAATVRLNVNVFMYLYTSYEWLLFCEIKTRCEGADPQQAVEKNPVAHPMESASSEVKTYERIIKSVDIE